MKRITLETDADGEDIIDAAAEAVVVVADEDIVGGIPNRERQRTMSLLESGIVAVGGRRRCCHPVEVRRRMNDVGRRKTPKS